MRAPRLTVIRSAIVAVAIGGLLPAAATGAHASGKDKECTSTSSTGDKASKYNRTPKGAGPWHVPLDPCNTEGTGASDTPYYNCAYWAAEKRPDVWVNAVWKYGYSSRRPGAWRVAVDAKKAGYSVDHKPAAGDIAAWGRNAQMGTTGAGVTYTASPGGHVAYVEKVLAHHRITISSMGQGSDGGYTTTLAYNRKHSLFIHQSS